MFILRTLALLALTSVLFYSCNATGGDMARYLIQEKGSQVVVLTPPGKPNQGGTGFEVKAPSGHVFTVTNAHVCAVAIAGDMEAHYNETERSVRLHVKEVSPTTDLCILEPLPAASGLSVATSINESTLKYSIGHPWLKPLTFTEGHIVSRENIYIVDESKTADTCIGPRYSMRSIDSVFGPQSFCVSTTDAYDSTLTTYPGDSGSPVFDSSGDVVGVVFASDQRTANGSFIPLDALRDFLSVY